MVKQFNLFATDKIAEKLHGDELMFATKENELIKILCQ